MTDSLDIKQLAQRFPYASCILHHENDCCSRALNWLCGVDHARCRQANSWDPPAWIRKEFSWAPHTWPLYWCEIPRRDTLDCGALAALAHQLFLFRGEDVYRAQVILRYPIEVMEQWHNAWSKQVGHATWISGNLCYHEACAIVKADSASIWDPTGNQWLKVPRFADMKHGAVVSIRIIRDADEADEALCWNGVQLRANHWHGILPAAGQT